MFCEPPTSLLYPLDCCTVAVEDELGLATDFAFTVGGALPGHPRPIYHLSLPPLKAAILITLCRAALQHDPGSRKAYRRAQDLLKVLEPHGLFWTSTPCSQNVIDAVKQLRMLASNSSVAQAVAAHADLPSTSDFGWLLVQRHHAHGYRIGLPPSAIFLTKPGR